MGKRAFAARSGRASRRASRTTEKDALANRQKRLKARDIAVRGALAAGMKGAVYLALLEEHTTYKMGLADLCLCGRIMPRGADMCMRCFNGAAESSPTITQPPDD